MGVSRRFILFELNEVPLRVVRHFAERHPHSAFAKVLRTGGCWDTFTPDEGHLSPWVTWPTLHRGVPSDRHRLAALGEDHKQADRQFPPVWSLLAAAGRRVGLFGSLHSYPLPTNVDDYAFYVPDTFAAGPETHPPELSAFQSFNLHMVDGSGRNVTSDLPVKSAMSFLMRAIPDGVRPATLAKIARQLASERIWPHRAGRRRTIQSLLAFDLFQAQLRSKKPDAAFFFSNHVASSMHRYWPAAFPEDYSAAKWSDSWNRRFSAEIDYTMSEADEMLANLIAFADEHPDFVVLISGSMGQAAVDDPKRQIRTEVLLRDLPKLLEQLGVEGKWERRRTMEPTYTLAFEEQASADAFMDAIAGLKIAGEPVASRRLAGDGVEFILGHPNVSDKDLTVTIGNRSVAPSDAGIANVPIEDEVGAAAYHVPEGMLLAYYPEGRGGGTSSAGPVSTTRIAPTLLEMQGVEPPGYMDRPLEEVAGAEMEPA